MLSHFSPIQLFATLWTIASQVPLSRGFCRQECWSRVPCPPPGDLPHPRIESTSLTSPALAGRFFTIIFVVVHSLSHVWLFATPWIGACRAFLSFTISRSLLKLMSIESVMPSNLRMPSHPLIVPFSSCLRSFPFMSFSWLKHPGQRVFFKYLFI